MARKHSVIVSKENSGNHNKRQRGFTLTEAAIVLGIVGVILGAIWYAAAGAYGSQRIFRTTEQITKIVGSLRSTYGMRQIIDTTASNADFARMGVFTSDMAVNFGTGVVENLWGTNTTITPVTVSGVFGAGFAVNYTQLPQEACAQLLLRFAGSSTRDAGLVGASNVAANNTVFPLTLTNAITACAPPASDMVLTFKLKP